MLKTPLHPIHVALGAKMTPFAGWDMPLSYTGIREEHASVRTGVGLFDLCHMGRFSVTGGGASALLDKVATNRMTDLEVGQARYAVLCDEEGGALDDILVYRLPDEHVVVVNASNREQDLAWITRWRDEGGFDAEVRDRSAELAMLAVQGPRAEDALARVSGGADEIRAMAYYSATHAVVLGMRMLVARTGYTGEDGYELYLDAGEAPRIFERLLDAGQNEGLVPVGLGARDTLRLEAAMPLYGHELTRETNPLEAGLGFAVKLDGRSFVGSEALARVKAQGGPTRRLVCITCDGKRIPREGQSVLVDGEAVGVVTSGTFSPTLERPICMAYVDKARAAKGTELSIDVRGNLLAGAIGPRPFVKRAR